MSLLCLNYAKSPAVAAVLITIALSLSSFSQAGYLLNIQVSLTVQSLQYHKVAQPMLNYFPLQFNMSSSDSLIRKSLQIAQDFSTALQIRQEH